MKKHVLQSLEDEDGLRCVDIIAVSDADSQHITWAEYRRDPEDPSGWRPVLDIPLKARPRFESPEAARAQAQAAVKWLASKLASKTETQS